MNKNHTMIAVLLAFLAAVFYAINIPFSKLLLAQIPTTLMAGLLYLGAGFGIAILYCFHFKKESASDRLSYDDLPYTLGMVLLDILAPILLMLGIRIGSAANAALLSNFEIVATSVIALCIFKEKVSHRLWLAILFISASSILLSFEGSNSFQFSIGSLFVLAATICWGFENNCTRKISSKSSYQIVMVKGFFSGCGSLLIGLLRGEKLPGLRYILLAMLLGFIAYGLSIFMYIRAQHTLGAAKTSAYYAVAPFVGSFLAFVFLDEALTKIYFMALALMILGSIIVIIDTLRNEGRL